jgi:hypothetical protein
MQRTDQEHPVRKDLTHHRRQGTFTAWAAMMRPSATGPSLPNGGIYSIGKASSTVLLPTVRPVVLGAADAR